MYLFEGGVGQHALPHLSYTESGDAQGLYVYVYVYRSI